ncbi:MAG: aminotransferase class I/II-fold pyridoxal phosphate-dependent enzyme [Ignavibacteriales bacterium]|nr:aminotransferase class I/II-fold pyridoxal phosphate-dependent enzyme [Ignavibacteriales bacterium]
MTPGLVPALNYIVRAFTKPGDPVIVQPPVYHPFYYAIENNGRRVVRNPLRFDGRRYTMDLDDLRAKIDAAGRTAHPLSPHNPVGRVWTRQELEALGRIAVERDLLVVSDEIHHDLVYRGHRHQVFAALAPELAQQTITCVAPSKTFNIAGLSTAVVAVPNPDLRKRFEDEKERSGFDLGQIFGITGFEAAYRHGEAWLDELLPYLEGNIDLMATFLAERLPEIKLIRPEGTYLGSSDLPRPRPGARSAQRLLPPEGRGLLQRRDDVRRRGGRIRPDQLRLPPVRSSARRWSGSSGPSGCNSLCPALDGRAGKTFIIPEAGGKGRKRRSMDIGAHLRPARRSRTP